MGGRCLCQKGYCAHDGICIATTTTTTTTEYCEVDTGGSCNVLSCHTWRGPTDCVGGPLQKKCLCQKGYCAHDTSTHDGVCMSSNATARIIEAQKSSGGVSSSSLAGSYIDKLPDSDDPMVVAMLFMMFAALGIGYVVRSFRHRMDASTYHRLEEA